jgi:hypothetical protein
VEMTLYISQGHIFDSPRRCFRIRANKMREQ